MQDRKTYAKGSTLESATGYVVKVGMPVVDDTVTANQYGNAEFTALNPITDGQYLVTLEVNGEAVAYKETFTADGGEINIGEYDISYDDDYATIGVTADDIVRLLIEPLKVSVSDGFRAAVKSLGGSESSGGGSGGGVLVVHEVEGMLDKTWQEIMDAVVTTGAAIVTGSGNNVSGASIVTDCIHAPNGYAVITKPAVFVATLSTDYPVVDEFGGGGSGPIA
jgi:hypothetical protein